MEFRPLPNKYFLMNVNGILKWHQFPGYFLVDGDFVTIAKYPPPYCILHQIAFRQGAAILDALRQGQPFCMAQQKMYSPQKWAHSIVMLGAKLRKHLLQI